MKTGKTLFLVLASVSLVAAKPQDPEAARKLDGKGNYVVIDEFNALARQRGLYTHYVVSPTGHIIEIAVDEYKGRSADDLDLNFLSALSDLQKLTVFQAPVSPHAMDGLTKLKRLTYLRFFGLGVRDEHLAVVAKIPNLRELTFGATHVSAAGIAQLANLQSLRSLVLFGSDLYQSRRRASDSPVGPEGANTHWPGINDESVSQISRIDKLTALDISNTKVTDAGLKSIEGLVNLEVLYLPTHTNGTGLEHLQKLVKLRYLQPFNKNKDRRFFFASPFFCSSASNLPLDEITDRGAAFLRNMTEMEQLDLAGGSITDVGLRSLRGMTKLETLNLDGNQATDAGMEFLLGMTKLRSLNLNRNKISDGGLKYLTALRSLETLELSRTHVTDKGVAALLSLQKLWGLNLDYCPITDASAEALAKTTSLAELRLRGTKIGDTGLARLAVSKSLEAIDLQSTNVTDAGLANLWRMPKLQILWLRGDHITDAALADLARLTNLEELSIDETDVTAAGCERLRRALPKTRVGWWLRRTGPRPIVN